MRCEWFLISTLTYQPLSLVKARASLRVGTVRPSKLFSVSASISPAAAARNVSRNLFQYHLFSLLGAVLAGIAGLMTSYYVGSSAGAAITLYLAVWFFLTFFLRKKG